MEKTMDALEQLVDTVCRILKKQGISLNEKQVADMEKDLRLEIGGTNAYYPNKRIDDTNNVHRQILRKANEFKRGLAKKYGISVRQVETALKTPNMNMTAPPAQTSKKTQQPAQTTAMNITQLLTQTSEKTQQPSLFS